MSDKPDIPNGLPDDFDLGDSVSLMDTIQGICNESILRRTDIIGALECVKWTLIRSWLEEKD